MLKNLCAGRNAWSSNSGVTETVEGPDGETRTVNRRPPHQHAIEQHAIEPSCWRHLLTAVILPTLVIKALSSRFRQLIFEVSFNEVSSMTMQLVVTRNTDAAVP